MHWVTAKTNRLTKYYTLGNKTESCIQLLPIHDFYFMCLRNSCFPDISHIVYTNRSLLILKHCQLFQNNVLSKTYAVPPLHLADYVLVLGVLCIHVHAASLTCNASTQ